MLKKILFSFIAFFSCLPFLSFAHDSGLSYGEMLELYFGVATKQRSIPTEESKLHYSNLKEGSSLYQLLQIAVANKQFPDLALELPIHKPALESDLAVLLSKNFSYQMDYVTGKVLTFERLKNELVLLNHSLDKISEIENKVREDQVADEIFRILQTRYIHKEKLQDQSKPEYRNLADFVQKLEDPYTKYFSPKEGKQFMNMLKSSFAGIGIFLVHEEGQNPRIVGVIKDTPAEKFGLLPNDEILAVDGKGFSEYKNLDAFTLALKGEKGTKTTVQIKRGQKIIEKILIRDIIQLPILSSEKKKGVCYFKFHSFDIGSYKKLLKDWKNLLPCDMFVFDLRGNPGGVVDEVFSALELFIPKDKPLLTVNSNSTVEIKKSKSYFNFSFSSPTAILIDGATASAAEIFAGVLKHYYPNYVKLIGEKTYGKGSMQEVIEFPEHSILKYTMALWNIADQKKTLNKHGIEPDIKLVDDPLTEKDEVLEYLGLE